MIPIRCYTCGNLISNLKYIDTTINYVLNNKKSEELIEDLKLPNYCCHSYFINLYDTLYNLDKNELVKIYEELKT